MEVYGRKYMGEITQGLFLAGRGWLDGILGIEFGLAPMQDKCPTHSTITPAPNKIYFLINYIEIIY